MNLHPFAAIVSRAFGGFYIISFFGEGIVGIDYHPTSFTIGLLFHLVIGIVLITASKPIARLMCRGLALIPPIPPQ